MTATTPEAPTTVVVEQQPAPQPAAAAPAVPGMVPGVPLLVAGANVAGGVAAAALSVAGPAGLAVAGGAAAVAAAGTAASRIVRRARGRSGKGTTAAALRTARRVPAASSSSGSPSRSTTSSTRSGAVPSPRGAGSGSARSARPSASSLRSSASRLTPGRTGSPAAAPRPGQSSPGGGKRRAPHASSGSPLRSSSSPAGGDRSSRTPSAARRVAAGLARAAAGTPARQAKREQRREQRIAKGVERARKSAGLDPKTGQPTPAAGKGGKGSLTVQQGKALRRSALRHAARMTAAGVVAGVAGLASLAVNPKRPGRAWGTAARVWARLSGSSRSARARRDAAIRGEQLPGQTAVPADTVTDPTRPDTPPAAPVQPTQPARPQRIGATTEGDPMSDTAAPFARLSTAAETMLQAASTFDPETMAEFQALIEDLPDAMRTVQETLRVLAELSAERLPVEPVVVEEMAEGFRAMDRVVAALEEVPATYRRAHAEDLERHESPRNGIESERKWNV